MKSVYKTELKEAANKFLTKNLSNLMESKHEQAFAVFKRMEAEPGDQLDDNSFTLIEHLELLLNDKETADKIGYHFESIGIFTNGYH